MADTINQMALSPGHLLSEERVLRIPPLSNTKNLDIYRRVVRIATWNVRSLYAPGKLANVEAEMQRLNIDILGISEVRWPGTGRQQTSRGCMYYSGGSDRDHRYGTAIMLTNDVAKSVIDFLPLSDRVMLIKLATTHRTMNIIQLYAPTSDKPDGDVEEFYNQVNEALRLTKKGEITVIIGDMNAKVGTGAESNLIGNFGLGTRNARGDRLVQFCIENNFLIANTFFKLHPRRLYTWTSPQHNSVNIVRNQIDFIMTPPEFKKYIKSVKTYPGADINSDHNPVVMNFRMRRFKNIKRTSTSKRINLDKLKDPDRDIGTKLEDKLQNVSILDPPEVERTWTEFKTVVTGIQEHDIGYEKNEKRKEWMTSEILELMAERRRNKASPTKYKAINRIIRKKCREAKESWLSHKCNEIESLQQRHDTFNIHRKVKEMTNIRQKSPATILRNENNDVIIGIEAKLERWKQYIEELFHDNRPESPPTIDSELNEEGPAITKDEVIHAIKAQKSRKATGPDNIHADVIKLIADKEGKGLEILTSLFNTIRKNNTIPSDWLKSTFITLPKKQNASNCDDYRMISLMSHILKIFLRIIHTRIYKKCDIGVNRTQFGFRNGLGTREALFSLNVLTQRCRDMNVNVYACFIDYRKAFDCVKHDKLIEILKKTGIDREEIKVISQLYWHQTAEVRIENETSEAIAIRKGVRQGCILSPLLFNIYSESIFREALSDDVKGVKINGVSINNIRYADDTVMLSDNINDLQLMMDRIVQHSESFGLQINISKTKLLIFAKTELNANLLINGNRVEQVKTFKYLGTIINNQCDQKREIRSRIEQARKAFITMRKFFTRSEISLELRIRMIRCYIFSVLLYGCEAWTLDPTMEKKLEAFEMYLYRRILKISWVQKVTNVEVLARMRKPLELLVTIKKRKTEYIGHVMRGEKYELLRLIIEGKIQGKRSVGRRQNSWLKDLRRWFGCTSTDIFRAATSKIMIARWIANLRAETAG